MANGDLSIIRNAINTYNAGENVVEVYGIMHAFIRAMENKEDMFVLTETHEANGEEFSTFLTLTDTDDHVVFPMFTNMQELLRVKAAIGATDTRINVAIMSIDFVIPFLVEKNVCEGIVVDPESLNFNAPISFYEDMLKRSLSSHITLIKADITRLHTDAIVSSTDEHLSGSAGVDAAIQQAAGSEFCENVHKEHLDYADVIGTEAAGELRSKYVFFTRGIEYTGDDDKAYNCYYSCYLHCMNVAQQAECTSIAFPCLGAGENNVPMEIIVKAATSAVIDWLNGHTDYNIDIYFCCLRDGDLEKFQAFFDSIAG